MRHFIITCTSSLLLATGALADGHSVGPGEELAKLVFSSIEDKEGGLADMGEFTAFGNDIYVSMDYNNDGEITGDEFMQWDFGFNFIAEDEGQERAFETAQKILFAVWDDNGDGTMSKSEYHKAMIADFQRADLNDDAFLSQEEFLSGYIVNRAYRAAVAGK